MNCHHNHQSYQNNTYHHPYLSPPPPEPLPLTCISSRHSQKCITLQKLSIKLNINFSLLKPILVGNFFEIFCTAIYCKQFKLLTYFQHWQLGHSISYQFTYILITLVLNVQTNRPYTLLGQDFFVNYTWVGRTLVTSYLINRPPSLPFWCISSFMNSPQGSYG